MTKREIPRLALSVDEAAETLGMSRRTFERRVLPEIRATRPAGGRLVLIEPSELRRWLEERSARLSA